MKTTTGNKVRISITILPFINDMLEGVSKKSGVSKSSLMEQALQEYLKQQLQKDARALSLLTFDDLPSEEEWLSLQPDIE